MLLTYAIVASNILGSIAVVLITWGCVRGAKAEQEKKIRACPPVPATK